MAHIVASLVCLVIFVSSLFSPALATGRKLSALVKKQPLILDYHNGKLLKGDYTLNIIWYGSFSSTQRAILIDFIQSLNPVRIAEPAPSVSTWWKTTERYKTGATRVFLGRQLLDANCSLGKLLKNDDITKLAARIGAQNSISVVFTAKDIAVEGFCVSRCGLHGSVWAIGVKTSIPFIWVGNSEVQCPGQCAWPFHQPIYGPQSPPLVAPNGDVGVDGMVINLATLLAGVVTNPYRNGYFQGPADAPLEAVSACTGTFGSGAYSGYPGKLLVDWPTGGSFNSYGVKSRRFLVPAMWDPKTSSCSTLT